MNEYDRKVAEVNTSPSKPMSAFEKIHADANRQIATASVTAKAPTPIQQALDENHAAVRRLHELAEAISSRLFDSIISSPSQGKEIASPGSYGNMLDGLEITTQRVREIESFMHRLNESL